MKFANAFSNISIAAILATWAIMPTAQSQAEDSEWDFEYGFKHLHEVGADKYVVENKNLRKYTEWQNPPITYLGPKSNDVDCSLTRKFTFDRPTSTARLKVNLATYNFGGGSVGKASCWASVDGKDWKLVLDNPTPSRIDSYKGFDDELSKELTGSKELWVQMRLHVSRAPNSSYTLAQFGRSASNAKNNVFEIKAKLKPIEILNKPLVLPALPSLTPPNDTLAEEPYHENKPNTVNPKNDGVGKPAVKLQKLQESRQPVDLKTGLLAHYPYSGNANDHSGNEHHLEVNGSTSVEDRFGMPNSAYAFDGQDDFMFADIDERKGDFSLSLWAKADDVDQSRYRSVINVFDKTPGSKDTCQIHTSGGRYPTYQFFSSNPESFALVTTEWQHLAVTVSGKVIRFYENGDRVYSQELEGGEANKFSNIIIGRNRNRDRHFEGAIDDVYVYNRAITDAEVERLFNGGFEDTDGDGLTDDYEKGYGRYQIVDGQYTWKEAKADAEKRGGHLATFINDKEWESFLSIVGGKDNVPYGAWMGGTDEKTEGAWEWITNELWKFTNWRRGEPNNAGGNEDHLHVWHIKSNTDKQWNDQRTGKFPYILEYGYYTDPTLADSDGDRVDDGVEVAAKTDPNNPLSRPAPDRDAPGAPPPPPPGPDYVKKIEELTKDNAAKAARIEDLETAEKAHLATIADLNATNVSLTATVEAQKKTIANLNAENAGLKQQLGNSREEVVNVSYELTETKEQLQAAIDVARTPFVNGWVYDPQQGWLFTDADHYPLVYSHSTESWHYYELGTADPRFFYSYKTQEWEAWDPMPEQTETAVASSQSETTNQNL